MVFTYTAFGVGNRFEEYFNMFLNRMAANAVSIEERKFAGSWAKLKLKTSEEEAEVNMRLQGPDIVITFTVQKPGEKKTLEKLQTGINVLGRLLYGDITGAALEAASESIESALSGQSGALASLIANTAREIEEELKRAAPTAAPAPEEMREVENLTEEVRAKIIALREEAEIAKMEGRDVKSAMLRIERAVKLFSGATADASQGKYSLAKSKLEAAMRLLQKAEEILL